MEEIASGPGSEFLGVSTFGYHVYTALRGNAMRGIVVMMNNGVVVGGLKG